jgi:hypothetical protein
VKKERLLLPLLLFAAAAGTMRADSGEKELRLLSFIDYAGHVFHATSSLESGDPYSLGSYGMHLLFDGDNYTGWSEGAAGDGTGEVLWLRMDPEADTLLLKNGFARRKDLFEKNNRVKKVDLSIWSGVLPAGMVTEVGPAYVIAPETETRGLLLEDTSELREYSLPFEQPLPKAGGSIDSEEFLDFAAARGLPEAEERRDLFLRIEITEVYPGSLWNDTCLTELRIFSKKFFRAEEDYSSELYSSDTDTAGTLCYLSPEGYRRNLFRERGFLFDPYLTSEDGRWCVAFRTPAETGGRVETDYVLFRLPYPEAHKNPDFAAGLATGLIPVDFLNDEEEAVLLFDDGSRVRLE